MRRRALFAPWPVLLWQRRRLTSRRCRQGVMGLSGPLSFGRSLSFCAPLGFGRSLGFGGPLRLGSPLKVCDRRCDAALFLRPIQPLRLRGR
jgi:hypothetical protein